MAMPARIGVHLLFTGVAIASLAACSGGGGGGGNSGGTQQPGPPPPPTPQAGQIQFAAASYSVNEAAGTLTITITRTGGSDGARTFLVSSKAGTATANVDYTGVSTTMSFSDGDAADKTITLTVANDSIDEPNETLTLELTTATGTSDATTTITIIDDDEPPPPAPSAVTLVIGYGEKKLSFVWGRSIGNVTAFRFMQKLPGGQFSQLSADLPASATTFNIPVPVHKYDWSSTGPQYRVDACNGNSCTPSNVITADQLGSVLSLDYLKASDTSAGAAFGTAVAVSGDGKTIAIGAPGADGNVGNVHIYTYGVTSSGESVLISQPFKIAAPATEAMRFGFAVALSADGNTLAVGAPDENSDFFGAVTDYAANRNNSAPRSGAVFVYTRTDGRWSSAPVAMKPLFRVSDDAFGSSVALSPEGIILIAGAPGQDTTENARSACKRDLTQCRADELAVDSGAVSSFDFRDGTWLLVQTHKAANAGAGDRFGSAVAVSSDGNLFAVGAPNEDSSGSGSSTINDETKPDSGAVYLFRRTSLEPTPALWIARGMYKASNSGAGDLFGTSVSLDFSGTLMAVGAPNQDGELPNGLGRGTDTGAIYVYQYELGLISVTLDNMSWGNAPVPINNGSYGSAVALSGNGNVLAVSSIGDSGDQTGVGTDRDQTAAAQQSGAVEILVRARVNGDGSIGDPGSFYVKANNTGAADRFGTAVSLSNDGDTLVVGAPGEDGSGTGSSSNNNPSDNSFDGAGAAYLY